MSKTRDTIQSLALAFLVAVAPVAGCTSPPPMSHAQQQEYERLGEERDAAVLERDQALEQAQVAGKQLEQLSGELVALEEGTAEHAAKLQEVATALQAFEAWRAEAEGAVAEAEDREERLMQLEAEAARGLGGLVVDSVSPMLPGSALAKPWLVALAPLLFKRPRQHFGKAVRELNPFDGQVAPVDAVLSLARAYGLQHSSEDPEELTRVAAKKAKAQGMRLVADESGDVKLERASEEPANAA